MSDKRKLSPGPYSIETDGRIVDSLGRTVAMLYNPETGDQITDDEWTFEAHANGWAIVTLLNLCVEGAQRGHMPVDAFIERVAQRTFEFISKKQRQTPN